MNVWDLSDRHVEDRCKRQLARHLIEILYGTTLRYFAPLHLTFTAATHPSRSISEIVPHSRLTRSSRLTRLW